MNQSNAAGPPLVALLSAAATALSFQICLLALVRSLPGPGYLAFGVGLNAFAALAIGGAVARAGAGVPTAVAVWAALEAALFFPAPRTVPLAAAFGLVTAILLARTSRSSPAARGTVVGGALCLTLVIFPRALLLAWPEFPEGVRRDALRVAVYAALVATVPGVGSLDRIVPRLPSPAAIMVAALAAAAALTPHTWQERPWMTNRTAAAPSGAPPGEDRPSILLLVLDTVRADHLSTYGYERDTTPEIGRFAARFARARVYPLAFSPAPWTVPAHASLLTGLLPSSHGAHSGNVVDAGRSKSVPGIRADRTLAETLRSGGYATGAVFANVHLGTTHGLERGFDVYFQPRKSHPLFLLSEKARARFAPWLLPEAAKPYPDAAAVGGEILRFVAAAGPRPWFAMANFMEAHQPYAARAPFAGRFGGRGAWNPPVLARADDSADRKRLARDRYDEEIASLDARVGELLAELERRGALANTWIVITSDHGEAFGEHGTVNHGSSVYNEQVRVPLIVVPPEGVELPRREGAVSLLDVATTLAAVGSGERLGAGHDLREPRTGDEVPARIEFFGNPSQRGPSVLRRWGVLWNTPQRAVVWGDAKLVERAGRTELYDLGADPSEVRDLSGDRTATAAALAPLLPPLASSDASAPHTLTPAEREALRALGYLGD